MQEQAKVKDVMKAYMNSYDLTQEKFAAQITTSLVNTNISRVSVTNWCNAKSAPSTDFLLLCAVVYDDWRRSWAMSCLKAKLPEVFDSGVVTFHLLINESPEDNDHTGVEFVHALHNLGYRRVQQPLRRK